MYGGDQGFPPQGCGGPPMGGRGRGGPMGGRGRGRGRGHDFGYGGGPSDFFGGFEQSPLDAEVEVVLNEMHGEIAALDSAGEYGEQFKNARRLLTTEVDRLENNIGRLRGLSLNISISDPEWLEVDIEKPIKLVRKILIPTFRNPRFNYVGKVLGPKGTTLQNIAKHHKCHVYILGRGSTRDRAKEEEMLNSGDPNFAHFAGPLHIKVETNAPPALAYQRVSGVLDVLQQLLQPVKETYIPGITNPPEDAGGNDKKNGGNDDGDENGEGKKEGDDEEANKYAGKSATGSNRGSIGARGGFVQRGGGGFQGRGGFRGGMGRGMGGGRGRGMGVGGPMMRGRGGGGGRGHGFAPY